MEFVSLFFSRLWNLSGVTTSCFAYDTASKSSSLVSFLFCPKATNMGCTYPYLISLCQTHCHTLGSSITGRPCSQETYSFAVYEYSTTVQSRRQRSRSCCFRARGILVYTSYDQRRSYCHCASGHHKTSASGVLLL